MQEKSTQNITQKEAFLKYLGRMDIEMIDMILDDSIVCFGVSKKLFLEKLSFVFNNMRLGGEKGFLKIKQHKKHANTYYLILKTSCFANKFIIEEKEGHIIKILGTKTITSKDDIESLSYLEFFFGDDQKIDFIPSNEYVMNVYRCTKAYEELVNDKIQILTSKDVSQWIHKHRLLYEDVKEAYLFFSYDDFRHLFSLLEYLYNQLEYYDEVKMALESYDDSNTTSLEQWLADNYLLAFCKVEYFGAGFLEFDAENNLMKYGYYSNIYFEGDDFYAIVKFNELVHKFF